MRQAIVICAAIGAILTTPAAGQLPPNRELPNTLGELKVYSETLREEHQYEARNTPPGEPDVKGVYTLFCCGGAQYNTTVNAGIGDGAEGSHDSETSDQDPGLAGFDWYIEDGGGGPARAGYDNQNWDPFDNRRDDQ